MKRRVCCLLLGFCILCLPVQQVYAAPAGPAAKTEEKKPHEKEHEKPVPPKPGEKPVPPHEHEKPVPPHEKPKPHEEKKGPLGEEKPEPPKTVEKPEPPVPPHEKEKQEIVEKQPENTPVATPTATPKPTAIPTATPTPAPNVVQTSTQTTTSTSASTLGSEIVKYALKFVGNPYKYGGTSLTNGADCSGFVQSVYKHFNYSIARTSREQASSAGYMNVSLKESDLQPGDLIFYAKGNGVVYHVALYIGDGKVVHAANSRAGIIISEYTYMKPYKARRVIR